MQHYHQPQRELSSWGEPFIVAVCGESPREAIGTTHDSTK